MCHFYNDQMDAKSGSFCISAGILGNRNGGWPVRGLLLWDKAVKSREIGSGCRQGATM